ncbi:MAG TPA: type II toxin-antitoxin system RelE/ParE family toxin [Gammaproteobacteria bacterium]|nr:type II toxin-antitoxin system RelE/ParE family toxin [Gammaproteobacteria bacterium]
MSLKPLIWIGSSKDDLRALPEDVQDEIGYGLHEAQAGDFPDHGKPLKGFSGVIELICDHDKNTYRAVYATKLGNNIYVLHVFQKKSKVGKKTPKEEIELISRRLKTAKEIYTRGAL